MEENKTEESMPFSLVVISVIYGFMAYISILGLSEQYILFSIFLDSFFSKFFVLIETAVLIYISVGVYMRLPLARLILIGYNIFAISDILFTLIFIDKEKLPKDIPLQNFAYLNLMVCFTLYLILKFVRKHKEHFNVLH